LKQGIWKPLKYWGDKEKNNEDNFDFFEVLGKKASFYVVTKNEIAIEILPQIGKLKDLINVSDEPDWYLVELENSFTLEGYFGDKFLIKTKGSFSLKNDKEKLVALYVIPDDVDLEKESILRSEFTFCGYAGMKF
jgi:hypothetical protein